MQKTVESIKDSGISCEHPNLCEREIYLGQFRSSAHSNTNRHMTSTRHFILCRH